MKTFEDALNEVAMEALHERFDYMRCQRKDGSYYGTGGQCRKGTRSDKDPNEKKTKKTKKNKVEKPKVEENAKERQNKLLDELDAFNDKTWNWQDDALDKTTDLVHDRVDGNSLGKGKEKIGELIDDEIAGIKSEGNKLDRDDLVQEATDRTMTTLSSEGATGQQAMYAIARDGASMAKDMKDAENKIVELGFDRKQAQDLVERAMAPNRGQFDWLDPVYTTLFPVE